MLCGRSGLSGTVDTIIAHSPGWGLRKRHFSSLTLIRLRYIGGSRGPLEPLLPPRIPPPLSLLFYCISPTNTHAHTADADNNTATELRPPDCA